MVYYHDLVFADKESFIIIEVDIPDSRYLVIEPIKVQVVATPHKFSHEHILMVLTDNLYSISIGFHLHAITKLKVKSRILTSIFGIERIQPIDLIKNIDSVFLSGNVNKSRSWIKELREELLLANVVFI